MIKPMLCIHLDTLKDNSTAKYFFKRGITKLLCQPKLNGIRALWNPEDRKLYTRGGHVIKSVPHLVDRLGNVPFDGELYHSTMEFNRINGAVRTHHPTEDSLQLEYYIFDLWYSDSLISRQCSRITALNRYPTYGDFHIVCTHESTVSCLEEVMENYLRDGFEGAIFRNLDALYKPGRHIGNLWAIKPTYEVEAMFLGFLPPGEDTSLHQGTFGSLLLKLPNNSRTFSCSGITEMERVKLWNDPPAEGTWITIKFGAWSSDHPEKAVPIFPRFKCIRWDK